MQNIKGSQSIKTLSFDEQFGRLILSLAIIFGSMVRFFPTLLTSFPVLDGGMFYVAIGNILANGFRLPETILYNQLNIPFTYPPFGFYMAALLEKVTGLDRIDILRFLPPICSLLAILAVYYLAYVLFEKTSLAALAAALYALLPRSLWLIMGGSITRAPGMIFSIMTIACLYSVCFKGDYKKKWFVMLFGSLVVLSHPEAAFQTAGICLWFLLFAPKKRNNFIVGMQIVGAIILLTSPWWITLLARYGIEPIRSALGTGGAGIAGSFMWPFTNFAEEQFLPVITITALWGAIFKLYQKEFLLPVWICIPFLLSHRSAPSYAIIPLALLGTIAISKLLIPTFAASRDKTLMPEDNQDEKTNSIKKVVVGILIIYALSSAFLWSMMTMKNYVVSKENQKAMQWVGISTPLDAHFLLLTGESNSGLDEVQEWFPALAERVSVTTIQGKEWQPGNQFNLAADSTKQLQYECPFASVTCIEAWGEKNQIEYDYVYVENTANSPYSLPIVDSLSTASDYNLVYTSPEKEILIFQRQNH
ncbi:MAG: glycosyltransferase family 39 protein [Anaerolineales bacterium]